MSKRAAKRSSRSSRANDGEDDDVDEEDEEYFIDNGGDDEGIYEDDGYVDDEGEAVLDDGDEDYDFGGGGGGGGGGDAKGGLKDDDVDELLKGIAPKRRAFRKRAAATLEDPGTVFAMGDFSDADLRPDHVNRPLWVTDDGHLFLETFNPHYARIYDFIITIAEPVYRPFLIHEYQFTSYSLWGAVSVGLDTHTILTKLEDLCKTVLPQRVENMIRECTESYGKAKLILHQNRYFIESSTSEVLQVLLGDGEIAKSRIRTKAVAPTVVSEGIDRLPAATPADNAQPSTPAVAAVSKDEDDVAFAEPIVVSTQSAAIGEGVEEEDEAGLKEVTQSLKSFEINPFSVGVVKQRCSALEFPLLEEYDFRNDPRNPPLDIDLKPTTTLRPYQEKSLSQMFRNGRARSGLIVLACGAGKTLVGVTAACTIKKSVLVLCTGGVSVDQWRDQFLLWSTVNSANVVSFTSSKKNMLKTEAGVLVTTYSMLTNTKPGADTKKVLDDIQKREWGLLILDEVHVVPAATFRRVIDVVHSHAKLGLTATLVREDGLVADLNFLIGPKLYEASWQDLASKGYIAKVQPAEVWCPMTAEFMVEYNKAEIRRKDLIAAMNPEKFRACQFLIQYHEARNDKILVFSDNVFALREYATAMKRPYLFGRHHNSARNEWFQRFRHSPLVKTLFVSKIGDNSIDLPGANVLIQITFQFGSNRQEAQRLGRLLRPKGRMVAEEYNGFFYSLVSRDTREMFFSTKRQQFLIKQGYSFKIIHGLPVHEIVKPVLSTRTEEQQLLMRVLDADESDLKDEGEGGAGKKDAAASGSAAGGSTRRKEGSSLAARSGGTQTRYMEHYHGKEGAALLKELQKIAKH